jgi:hypothetical protein
VLTACLNRALMHDSAASTAATLTMSPAGAAISAAWPRRWMSLPSVLLLQTATMTDRAEPEAEAALVCRECSEPIRRTRPDEGYDLDEIPWTHESGGPVCDFTPMAWPAS